MAEQNGPFPDANTFPYPRLCVPEFRGFSNYPRYSPGKIEYVYYEKEQMRIGKGDVYLVWKEIEQKRK